MNGLTTTAPPMTVKAFKDIFQMDLEEKVIKRSVEKSSNAAEIFINNILQKEMKH